MKAVADHPGMVFLLRASARFDLVEAGEMEIEEAIMGLAQSFYDLVHPMCPCARDIYDRMERYDFITRASGTPKQSRDISNATAPVGRGSPGIRIAFLRMPELPPH